MLILSLQMYEYHMDLLLIMMDHNKIHNSFIFKSNSGIKYQEFFQDFTKFSNDIYYNLPYSIAYLHNFAQLSQ